MADVEVLELPQVLRILGGGPNHLGREILNQLELPGPDHVCRSARTVDVSRVTPDELPGQPLALRIAVRDRDDP